MFGYGKNDGSKDSVQRGNLSPPTLLSASLQAASMESVKTVFATVFLPDGKHLLATDSAGKAYVWEVDQLLDASYWTSVQPGHKPEPLVVHQLHDCAIYSVCLLSDTVLLTGGDDCIKVWKVDSLLPGQRKPPQLIHTLIHPHVEVGRGGRLPVSETNGLAVNSSRSTFYSACGDGCAYAWDSDTFKPKNKLEGHTNYLHCVACQGDQAIVTGSEDGTVRIWDARDPRESDELTYPVENGSPGSWVGAVDIDPGGQWVAAGGGGRYVGLWHLSSRKFVAAMPTCGALQALQFCDDKLVSGGAEPALYLWSRSGRLCFIYSLTCMHQSAKTSARMSITTPIPTISTFLTKVASIMTNVSTAGKLAVREKAPMDCIYSITSRPPSLGALLVRSCTKMLMRLPVLCQHDAHDPCVFAMHPSRSLRC